MMSFQNSLFLIVEFVLFLSFLVRLRSTLVMVILGRDGTTLMLITLSFGSNEFNEGSNQISGFQIICVHFYELVATFSS